MPLNSIEFVKEQQVFCLAKGLNLFYCWEKPKLDY